MSPAVILLMVGLLTTAALGLFLVYVLFFGKRGLNIWGPEQPSNLLELAIYIVTGIWLVKGTAMFSMTISHKFPYWCAGICFMMAVVFFALYVYDIMGPKENMLYTAK